MVGGWREGGGRGMVGGWRESDRMGGGGGLERGGNNVIGNNVMY